MILTGEFGRKIVHLSFSLIALPLIFCNKAYALLILTCLCGISLLIEQSRVKNGWIWRKISFFWLPMLRPAETESPVFRLKSADYYVLSLLLAAMFFDKNVAVTAFWVMAFGDSAAGIIGRKYGAHRIVSLGGKSIEGGITMFLISAVVIYITPFLLHAPSFSITALLISSLVATCTEMAGNKMGFDDNFNIVIATATALQVMS